ncbi:MAG: ROK family protein [Xanthomonadales bacterium]|nr:ROK family protein [Xanthomonadales bacterium]
MLSREHDHDRLSGPVLGIDVGGSGIKAAVVNTKTGELLSTRERVDTPEVSTPQNVVKAIAGLVEKMSYRGIVGCALPSVVTAGQTRTAGNLDPSWRGCQVDQLLAEATRCDFVLLNDADAAGLAEITLGSGSGLTGKLLAITIGTGLGSGFFLDGKLVPNFELGRLYDDHGRLFEQSASGLARKRDGLSWQEWAERFNLFLAHVQRIFSPDHVILGGGASRKFEKFRPWLMPGLSISAAHFGNNAGIIGAAIQAAGVRNGVRG